MRLPDGFVLANRYRVLGPGSAPGVWDAESVEGGPGRVELRVARYDRAGSDAELATLREEHDRAFARLVALHRAGCPSCTPIERVLSYCPDPELRPRLKAQGLLRGEVWHVVSRVEAPTLLAFAQSGAMDEERVLLVALRLLLILRRARARGLRFVEVDLEHFCVELAGEDVLCVNAGDVRVDAELGDAADDLDTVDEAVPVGFGRAVVTLLTGVRAPGWPSGDPRWASLLGTRRVGREYEGLVGGCLGMPGTALRTWEQVENRLRSLVRAFRQPLWGVAPRAFHRSVDLTVGRVLTERFELREEFAQGARGQLLLATDRASGRDVLVKTNKYQYDSAEQFALELPSRRAELEHEYETLRALAGRTSMVPQPIALVRAPGRGGWFDLAPTLAEGEPWLVMEKLPGRSLLHLLPDSAASWEGARDPRNRLRPLRVVRLVERLAGVLAIVHDAGLLYQDLKPDNVLFDPETESLYLVDFASACPRLRDGALDRTSVAFGMQTHGFAAPEFGERWEKVDGRFDLYSLGALAWHLLTGVNPERVAVEQGSEYPELRRELLADLPPAVRELVEACLAPVDRRPATARDVRRMASMTRLRLSRSRPLDVVDLRAAWRREGVHLTWRLPDDPRVARVALRSEQGDEVTPLGELAGATEFVDRRPLTRDRTYWVETVLVRRGETLHSRGIRLDVASHPAPTALDVERRFGGVSVRASLAAHADGVYVVLRRDRPPTSVDDGAVFPLDAEGVVSLAADADAPVFVAAFARYGERLSSPRFASAVALPALPELSLDVVGQDDARVRLRVRPAIQGAVVEAVDPTGRRRLDGRAGFFDDLDAPRGAPVRYDVVVEHDEVRTEVLARAALTRWREPPRIVAREGWGEAGIRLESLPEGWSLARVRVSSSRGSVERVEGDSNKSPAVADRDAAWRLRVPGGGSVELCARLLVEPDGAGPTGRVHVVVPPEDARVEVEVASRSEPPVATLRLPASASGWTGVFVASLRVQVEGGLAVDERWPVSAFQSDADGLFLVRELVEVAPDQLVSVSARLESPTGDVRETPSPAFIAVGYLPVPTLTAGLGSFHVACDAQDEVGGVPPRFDVSWTHEGNAPVVHAGVHLPGSFDVPTGARVEVRIRRASDRVDMPWTPPAKVRARRLPDPPRAVEARRTRGGVRFRVELARDTAEEAHSDAPVLGVRVETSDGRLVHDGTETVFWDVADEEPEAWLVTATEGELRSAPLRVVAETLAWAAQQETTPGEPERRDASSASASASASREPVASASGGRWSWGDASGEDVRVVRCVTVEGLAIAEIVGPPAPREIALFADASPEAAEAAADAWIRREASREGEREVARGPRALQVAGAARELVPWTADSERWATLVWRSGHLGSGAWRRSARAVPIVAGKLVGAAIPRPDRVHLYLPVDPSLRDDVAPPRLGAWTEDQGVIPWALHDVELRTEGRHRVQAGTLQELAGSRSGLHIFSGPGEPRIYDGWVLVSLVESDERAPLRSRVWVDAVRSFQRAMVVELQRTHSASVASVTTGLRGRADVLVAGAHARVEWSVPSVRADGRATVEVTVQAVGGGYDRRRLLVPLADAVARAALVRRWSIPLRAVFFPPRASPQESA